MLFIKSSTDEAVEAFELQVTTVAATGAPHVICSVSGKKLQTWGGKEGIYGYIYGLYG